LDALEKRRKRMQAAATTKDRKGSGSGSGSERRRRNDRQLVALPMAEPISRKKGKSRRSRDASPPAGAAPPGMLISGGEGATYAPLGYYPPQAGANRNSPTRPRSATSQQLRGAPPQYPYQQSSSSRHYPEGIRPTSSSSNGSRRPLPDEEDWQPVHSRRSSVSSGPVDPFEYQIDSGYPPPIPQHYMQGRRNISGPPEVAYSSVRRSPPPGPAYPSMARGSSDPTLRHKSSRRDEVESLSSNSEEEDESDDLGNGVQVFVEEERPSERERAVARKPVGGRKKGKGR